jgi:hypothetical protein
MTSTTDRRLAKLESALSPTATVLAWLSEAQEFASSREHARSIAQLPVESAPLSVIGQRIEASVRASMKGQPQDVVWEKVRRGVGDGAFLFCLVLQINGQTIELTTVEGLRASAVFYWMGCLLGGPRETELPPAEAKEYRQELAECWESWRGVVDRLSVDVQVENEARARLEKRYFDGRDVFFRDVAESWSHHVELVERIAGLAEAMELPGKPRSRRPEREASRSTASEEERFAHRAQTLADDARVRAYDIMGERERGAGIMERRLLDD